MFIEYRCGGELKKHTTPHRSQIEANQITPRCSCAENHYSNADLEMRAINRLFSNARLFKTRDWLGIWVSANLIHYQILKHDFQLSRWTYQFGRKQQLCGPYFRSTRRRNLKVRRVRTMSCDASNSFYLCWKALTVGMACSCKRIYSTGISQLKILLNDSFRQIFPLHHTMNLAGCLAHGCSTAFATLTREILPGFLCQI